MKELRTIDLQINNVVENFYLGNTQVKICDDFCVKTSAEVEEILKRIKHLAVKRLIKES